MKKPTIFISHIHEESDIAKYLKVFIEDRFLNLVTVFVSSHDQSLKLGDKWLDTIETAMRESEILIVLCSATSVQRPWINFEAGAGWLKAIPVIPICHSGMDPGDLPFPLTTFQGAVLNEPKTIQQIFIQIAKFLDMKVPDHEDPQFYATLKKLEAVIAKNEININLTLGRGMLFSDIEKLKHSIYTSVLDSNTVNSIDIRHDDISKLNFKFSDLHHIFDFAYYITLKQKKVFEIFSNRIKSAASNIKFLLTSQSDILPQELKSLYSLFLIYSGRIDSWKDELLLIDFQKNGIKETLIDMVVKADEVPQLRDNNMINYVILYYETLGNIRDWIVSYENAINRSEKSD